MTKHLIDKGNNMLIDNNFLKKLKDFNLNSYEAKLWVALLSRGVSTAGELSDIANVPRSRSYDVLESLEKKGFVVMKLGKPIKYIAVPPSEVVERLKKNVVSNQESQIKLLQELKKSTILSELEKLFTKSINLIEPSQLSGCLKGRRNIYNHLESMIGEAKQSIVISTTDNGLIRKLDRFNGPFMKAKENNVDIVLSAPLKDSAAKKHAELHKEILKVEKQEKAESRFAIIDNKQVLIMLLNDQDVHSTSDIAVWVNTPLFASSLSTMFFQ